MEDEKQGPVELDQETLKTLLEMAREYEHAKWLKKHLFIWVPVICSAAVIGFQAIDWFIRYVTSHPSK